MTAFLVYKDKNKIVEHEASDATDASEKSVDEKIADVCFQIKEGLSLSPEGDFSFRIRRLIRELPKPDILVVMDDPIHHKVYSTIPEATGNILCVSKIPSNTMFISPVDGPEEIRGSVYEWTDELFNGSNTNLTEFLEKFIVKNT